MIEKGSAVVYTVKGQDGIRRGTVRGIDGNTLHIEAGNGDRHRVKARHAHEDIGTEQPADKRYTRRHIPSKRQARVKVQQRRRHWARQDDRAWKAGNAKPCITFEPRY